MNGSKCPVCLNTEPGTSCQTRPALNSSFHYDYFCDVCGAYRLSVDGFRALKHDQEQGRLTLVQRAVLSHRIRSNTSDEQPFQIDRDWLDHVVSSGRFPSPTVQAMNILRWIGDEVTRTGESVVTLPLHFHATIGAPHRTSAFKTLLELTERKYLTATPPAKSSNGEPMHVDLSLVGWDRYEAEKRGQFRGSYGFLARKFNDPDFDPFVQNVVKPAVEEGTGYDLVDMNDVSRAGVIDNIMRAQIRDAAFVISDLTHANLGAYWEAGFAEGLGKPVIYICEKNTFEDRGTHFDTNHCTTIFWSKDDHENFREVLIATLRRSLDLHGSAEEPLKL